MNVLHLTMRGLSGLLLFIALASVDAARVPDLYSARVEVADGEALNEAEIFDRALAAVMVKITGNRGIMANPDLADPFSPAEKFVQQHRTNPDGSTWVLFDQVALRRALDQSGQPVWGDERPATLAWIVLDEGDGTRDILAAAADDTRQRELFAAEAPPDSLKRRQAVREVLLATADERGLPLVLPLVDSEELALLSVADIWGGYNDSLTLASRRYGVDAILIGRARVNFVEVARVRWTLLFGDERFDWEGPISGGPDRVADFFAARFATSGKALDRMQLRVDGIVSLEDYGRLSRYLSSLDVIESFSVDEVRVESMIFSLTVRGDANRLTRSIALRRVLQPVGDQFEPRRDTPGLDPFERLDSTASLHYTLIAGP